MAFSALRIISSLRSAEAASRLAMSSFCFSLHALWKGMAQQGSDHDGQAECGPDRLTGWLPTLALLQEPGCSSMMADRRMRWVAGSSHSAVRVGRSCQFSLFWTSWDGTRSTRCATAPLTW